MINKGVIKMKTEIFPAIDMRNGMVVRLLRGDYDKMTVYGGTPVDMAFAFDDMGAKYLHVVDLDGAKDGETKAKSVVKSMVEGTSLKLEIGGGIRTETQIEDYLLMGVERVILGTIAMTDLDFTKKVLDRYGKGIAIGIDIKDGYAAIKGWKELSDLKAHDAFRLLCDLGAETIICTDVSKDGAMKGIDVDFYGNLVDVYTKEYGCGIVSSGGVTTLDDVKALSNIGLEGIIIGRAIYDGSITLEDAIRVCEEAQLQ